jgi:hypothetical protein
MNSLKKIVVGAVVLLSITISNAKTARAFDNSSRDKAELTLIENHFAIENKQGINQLQPVFDSYFLLKDALVKTDSKAASFESNRLLKAITGVKMETLNGEERASWKQWVNSLSNNAKKIANSQDVIRQRGIFKVLSKTIYELIKASKPIGSFYYQYCPMADGYWLSKENAIKNPYYGSQMLSCGRVTETIKRE